MLRSRASWLGLLTVVTVAVTASCLETKHLNGEPCVQDRQCESANCQAGMCAPPLVLGEVILDAGQTTEDAADDVEAEAAPDAAPDAPAEAAAEAGDDAADAADDVADDVADDAADAADDVAEDAVDAAGDAAADVAAE